MRKVLFLMFLLLLMGLGAAGVKAQVRIGGNGAPNAAAVLDLNATDATNNGTKGLALPRVDLTSTTMQLTTGVANLTGMLVYNTTTTLGQIGIYYWNGSSWVLASLPATSTSAAGQQLISTGSQWVAGYPSLGASWFNDSIKTARPLRPITWNVVVDTTLTVTFEAGKATRLYVQGVRLKDICFSSNSTSVPIFIEPHNTNEIAVLLLPNSLTTSFLLGVYCFRATY